MPPPLVHRPLNLDGGPRPEARVAPPGSVCIIGLSLRGPHWMEQLDPVCSMKSPHRDIMVTKADLPTQAELTAVVLRAIQAEGGRATNEQIAEGVVEDLGLSADKVALLHDPELGRGRTELEYRLAWARTRLKEQGRIHRRSAGVWALKSNSLELTRP